MNLNAFFPHILAEVPSCPDPTVRLALIQTAVEFCRDTLAWSELLPPVAVTPGVPLQTIPAPTDGRALTVLEVYINGREIASKTLTEIAAFDRNWLAQAGDVLFYNALTVRGTISLYPIPVACQMSVLATFIPTNTATTLPDFLGNYHMDVIASGVKSRLMLMPSVAWTNEKLGAYYKSEFAKAVSKTRLDEIHQRAQGNLQVPARPFR